MDELEKIQANARLVIEHLGPASGLNDFGLNAASLRWVDDFIARMRGSADKATREKFSSILGSFLGECVITQYGGKWEWSDDHLGVRVNERLTFFPFSKVSKHFQNEDGDSISAAFEIIGILKDEDILGAPANSEADEL